MLRLRYLIILVGKCFWDEILVLDLTFLTSNIVKLAHARYILSRSEIRVIGFRQRTYHATYVEPRISSRRELLDVSYRSALDQCRKAGILTNHQFFMLEDTSVRIEALSTLDCDFPGLDIKYWMESISFSELDAALRQVGNDRRAQVRSDVLLHVPGEHRSRLGVAGEYYVFTGKQDGYVIEDEILFESNVVFPWLDNRTFNKWFCPNDYARPLGALNINEADKVDFRQKALDKMFTLLYDNGVVERTPVQMNLALDDAINFILCGYTCAGKTTASQHFARMYGYSHVEASDFMHLSYYRSHGYRPNVAIGDFAEQALVQMPHIVAENVAEYIMEEERAPIVVSGFRSMAEVVWLQKDLYFSGKKFRVIFVDARQEERIRRMKVRNRIGDGVSLEDFRFRDEQQRRMGVGDIRGSSGIEVWNNDGSLEAYLEFIESQVIVAHLEDIDVNGAICRLKDVTDVKLEDAILVALLSVWSMDETRKYFSTPEITSMINKSTFPHIQPKHRENIHRYFNRDFYAYYEIESRSRGRVRVYRLSNTGYGRALRSLRSLVANVSDQASKLEDADSENMDVKLLE